MLWFCFQNINRTFFLNSKPVKYVRWYLACCLFASKCIICAVFWGLSCRFGGTFLLAFSPWKTPFVLSFQLSDYCGRFLLLISSFWNPKYICSIFLVGSQSIKTQFYLLVIILTLKNISSNLFVVYFSVNMYYVPFSSVLTWKSVNHIYLFLVYFLNTRRTPSFFFWNH